MEIQRKKSYAKKIFTRDDTIFREYIETTSANGVAKIFEKNYSIPRRLFWLVIIIGASVLCLYTIVLSIIVLAGRPTSTSVAIKSTRPLEFPGVTVCNLNVFTASSLENVGLLGVGIDVLNANPFRQLENECELIVSNISTANEIVLEDLWNVEGAQSLSQFIQYCTFLGKQCDMERDFIFSTLGYGACYTFNGYSRMPPLETNGTGMTQGLNIILNINQSEYTATPLLDAGARIYIHLSSQPAPIRNKGITIAPGRVAFVALDEQRVINQAKVDCVSDYGNERLNFLGKSFNYSSAACLVDCQLTAVAKRCGCYYAGQHLPPNNPDYSNIRNCTFGDVCCIQDVVNTALECSCPHLCHSVFYQHQSSYSSMPADYTIKYFSYDKQEFEKNFIGVFVYFETDIVKTETTSISYTFIDFLSDMGGQLGLFIGVSVITAFELCVWLLDEGFSRLFCFRISWKKKEKEKEGDKNGDVEKGYYNPLDPEQMENAQWS